MNEERLRKILEIENEAEALHEQASQEANTLPAQAEEQVRQLLEAAKKDAEVEAARLKGEICDPVSIQAVLTQNVQKMQQREALAKANMTKAINYVMQALLKVND